MPLAQLRRSNGNTTATEEKEQAFFQRAVRPMRSFARDDLAIHRLHWYDPFLEALMSTRGTGKVREYNYSNATTRLLEMAKSRCPAYLRIRTRTNPFSNTIAVWVERKPA